MIFLIIGFLVSFSLVFEDQSEQEIHELESGSKFNLSFYSDRSKENLGEQELRIYENVESKRLVETSPPGLEIQKNERTFDTWVSMINSAENQILIETKYLRYYQKPNETNEEYMQLIDALKRSAIRGVEIKILSPKSDSQIYEISKHERITLKHDLNTHSKLLIQDTDNVYVGSANWSGTGTIGNNREIGLRINQEEVVEQYRYIFSEGWKEAGGDEITDGETMKDRLVTPTVNGKGMPEDFKKISEIEMDLVRESENLIKGYYYYFSNSRELDKLEKKLLNAANRGVKVKLLVDILDKERRYRLEHENIVIREIEIPRFQHAHPKVLIIDGKYSHVSSANLTKSSRYGDRREIGALLKSPKIVSEIRYLFLKDWNSEFVDNKGRENEEIKTTELKNPIFSSRINENFSEINLEEELSLGKYHWEVFSLEENKIIDKGSFKVRETETGLWARLFDLLSI